MLRSLFENNPGKGAKKRKRNFWLYSVGEFVLIFLGILIALQVDNWNQRRQESKLEQVLLSEMLVNLRADLQDVEVNIGIQDSSMNSCQIVIDYLDGNIPYHDSLESHFGYLNGGTVFNENISAFESMKSIGIGLISNDSLRKQICHLYAVNYDFILSIQEIAHKHVLEQLNPAISEYLFTIESHSGAGPGRMGPGRAVPLDTLDIRTSNSFRHAVHYNIIYFEYQLRSYRTAKNQIINLISQIEKELL